MLNFPKLNFNTCRLVFQLVFLVSPINVEIEPDVPAALLLESKKQNALTCLLETFWEIVNIPKNKFKKKPLAPTNLNSIFEKIYRIEILKTVSHQVSTTQQWET